MLLYHVFIIDSSEEGHLSCLHFQTIMIGAAINTAEQVYVEKSIRGLWGIFQGEVWVDYTMTYIQFLEASPH